MDERALVCQVFGTRSPDMNSGYLESGGIRKMEDKQIDNALCLVGYYNEEEGQYIQPKLCREEQLDSIFNEAVERRTRDIHTITNMDEDEVITKEYKEKTVAYINSLKIMAIKVKITKIIKVEE